MTVVAPENRRWSPIGAGGLLAALLVGSLASPAAAELVPNPAVQVDRMEYR